MFGVTNLPTFLVGLVLIIMLPGPNSMYVLSVAARRGIRKGYLAASAVWIGDAVLIFLSAAGVASLLRTNEVVFGLVRWAGAGYLAFLAFGMLRGIWLASRRPRENAEELVETFAEPVVEPVMERPFRRALIISLLNPKAILLFMAFFVQFVDPTYAYPALSFLVLGIFSQIASVLYLSFLIFTGARLASAFRERQRLTTGANGVIALAFLAFAAKMSVVA